MDIGKQKRINKDTILRSWKISSIYLVNNQGGKTFYTVNYFDSAVEHFKNFDKKSYTDKKFKDAYLLINLRDGDHYKIKCPNQAQGLLDTYITRNNTDKFDADDCVMNDVSDELKELKLKYMGGVNSKEHFKYRKTLRAFDKLDTLLQ